MREITVHTDGAARGNPGPAAIAYIINGLKNSPVEFCKVISPTTNNQAEYQALAAAFEELDNHDLTNTVINCFSDSELMVRQLNGEYRIKDSALRTVAQKILSLKGDFISRGAKVNFTAIRRAFNKRADVLANKALDEHYPKGAV